jgi:hypothetical protein
MGNNSYDNTIGGWERLLAAVDQCERMFPSADSCRSALEWHLQEAKAAKARQVQYSAERQRASLDLRLEIAAGGETASRLRSLVTAVLGKRDERLVQFGVAPLRKRSRKSRTAKEEPSSSGSGGPEPAE